MSCAENKPGVHVLSFFLTDDDRLFVWWHVSIQAQQCSSSAAVQQCSSAADKGWRFVPDALLPGHRKAPQWVPARTPTFYFCLNCRKAVGGPFGSDNRYTTNTFG